jgi:hypothetical protein
MEDVGKFYEILHILRQFCIFYDHLVYFPALVFCTRKIWQPCEAVHA